VVCIVTKTISARTAGPRHLSWADRRSVGPKDWPARDLWKIWGPKVRGILHKYLPRMVFAFFCLRQITSRTEEEKWWNRRFYLSRLFCFYLYLVSVHGYIIQVEEEAEEDETEGFIFLVASSYLGGVHHVHHTWWHTHSRLKTEDRRSDGFRQRCKCVSDRCESKRK